MAKAAGFDVTIIDPRTAFATPERFADIILHAEWPEDILKAEPLDAFTGLAALAHPDVDRRVRRARGREKGSLHVVGNAGDESVGVAAEKLSGLGLGPDSVFEAERLEGERVPPRVGDREDELALVGRVEQELLEPIFQRDDPWREHRRRVAGRALTEVEAAAVCRLGGRS